ncbi:unnamed protein product, partial [Porites evermanni]
GSKGSSYFLGKCVETPRTHAPLALHLLARRLLVSLILLIVFVGFSKCKLDLGLVVDTTKSINQGNPNNINLLKNSLKILIRSMDISENGTHVSLETFAAESVLHNNFKNGSFYSVKAMEGLIDKSIGKLSQPTRLDYALFQADDEMFSHESGNRAGVRSVMVLYTDGKSHPDTKDFMGAVANLKKHGVRLVIVAIGKFSKKRRYRRILDKIAGKNVIFVQDYLTLQGMADDIQAIICRDEDTELRKDAKIYRRLYVVYTLAFSPSPCEQSAGLDVAFLVDRTRSLGRENYQRLKGFLIQIIDAINIGPNATHVGIILFSKYSKVLNTFSDSRYYKKSEVHYLIEDLSDKLKGRTFIDRALKAANNTLFTKEGGDRPKFPNALVLFTDGKTNKESKPYGEIIPSLKAKEVRITALGIGPNVKPDELKRIAGDNYNHSATFKNLPDFFTQILTQTCSVDGRFSRWDSWSKCSASCGLAGVQKRTRTCTNPPPQGYGKNCTGDYEQSRSCNTNPCPTVQQPESQDKGANGVILPQLKDLELSENHSGTLK